MAEAGTAEATLRGARSTIGGCKNGTSYRARRRLRSGRKLRGRGAPKRRLPLHAGGPIWSAENIEDLYDRFVRNPIETSESFEEKFRRQLEGAPLETKQLASELLYVYLLFPSNIGGDNKRRIVEEILDETSVKVPDALDKALDSGIASFGPALQNRAWQLTMLLEFLREWKTLTGREEVLTDPWKFKEAVFSAPHFKAGVQREALLHLAHPDTFDRIVSRDQKQDVAERFSYLTDEATRDVDQQIMEIRETFPQSTVKTSTSTTRR